MTVDVSGSNSFFAVQVSPANWALNKAVTLSEKKPCAARSMVPVSALFFIPSALQNLVALVVKATLAVFVLPLALIPPVKKRMWETLEPIHLVGACPGRTLLNLALHIYKTVMFLTFAPIYCLAVGMFSPKVCKAGLDAMKLTDSPQKDEDKKEIDKEKKEADQNKQSPDVIIDIPNTTDPVNQGPKQPKVEDEQPNKENDANKKGSEKENNKTRKDDPIDQTIPPPPPETDNQAPPVPVLPPVFPPPPPITQLTKKNASNNSEKNKENTAPNLEAKSKAEVKGAKTNAPVAIENSLFVNIKASEHEAEIITITNDPNNPNTTEYDDWDTSGANEAFNNLPKPQKPLPVPFQQQPVVKKATQPPVQTPVVQPLVQPKPTPQPLNVKNIASKFSGQSTQPAPGPSKKVAIPPVKNAPETQKEQENLGVSEKANLWGPTVKRSSYNSNNGKTEVVSSPNPVRKVQEVPTPKIVEPIKEIMETKQSTEENLKQDKQEPQPVIIEESKRKEADKVEEKRTSLTIDQQPEEKKENPEVNNIIVQPVVVMNTIQQPVEEKEEKLKTEAVEKNESNPTESKEADKDEGIEEDDENDGVKTKEQSTEVPKKKKKRKNRKKRK